MMPSKVARRPTKTSKSTLAIIAAVAVATAGTLLIAADQPVLSLLPALAATVVAIVVRVPLRWSTTALLFLLLAVDDHFEIAMHWRTPVAIVGDALHGRLDVTLRIPGLAVTGMEFAIAGLLMVYMVRRLAGSSKDAGTGEGWPGVLGEFLLLYVAAVAASAVLGLARGLPFAPWKLRNLLHPIALTLLFLVAYRRPGDAVLVGRVIVLAGVVRAVLCVVVQRIAIHETGGELATATTHGDSVLFAVAGFIVIMNALERLRGWSLVRAGALAAILAVGAVANGRRLVWLMLLGSLAFAYVITPLRGWKRSVSRATLLLVPVVILYFAVGWESSSKIFAPVRTMRGMSDTSKDRSAYWREVENWNIAMSIRANPVIGKGLGGEYDEFMANDEMASVFKEYREWPHNTILGQLLLLGVIGFTAIIALPALVIFLSARSFRFARDALDRVVAMGCVGAVLSCLVLAWADTGAHYHQYKIFMALAIAVSARLAITTGAWPSRVPPERVRGSTMHTARVG